jgi:hypothetical protein
MLLEASDEEYARHWEIRKRQLEAVDLPASIRYPRAVTKEVDSKQKLLQLLNPAHKTDPQQKVELKDPKANERY